jgi:hypothetical protein
MAKIHLDPWTDIVGVGWGSEPTTYLRLSLRYYWMPVNLTLYEGSIQATEPVTNRPALTPPQDYTLTYAQNKGLGFYSGGFEPANFSATPPASAITGVRLSRYNASGSLLGVTPAVDVANVPAGFRSDPDIKSLRDHLYLGWTELGSGTGPLVGGITWNTTTSKTVAYRERPITSNDDIAYDVQPPYDDLGPTDGQKFGVTTDTYTDQTYGLDFSSVSVTFTEGGSPKTFQCVGSKTLVAYSESGVLNYSNILLLLQLVP